jgi:MoxR-like ATPase
MKFEGTERYVATEDLRMAVNAAVALQRPLLIKGEPGTGKTMLAEEVAAGLGMPLIQWHIKSTTKAQQGLYEYDAVSRLRDSQLGDDKVHDVRNYIRKGKLWEAFTADEQAVLADRRGGQGGHRVSQRPAGGTRSDGVLRLRNR